MKHILPLLLLVVPSLAHADLRIWEQGVDDRGEVGDPHEHRWLDLSALLQPSASLLFRDDDLTGGFDDGGLATRLRIDRVRLGIHAQPLWWMRLRLETELQGEAFNIQDAYLDLRPHSAVAVMAGRFRLGITGAGGFHESRLGFVMRPAYADLVAIRGDGIQVHGRVGGPPGGIAPTFTYALSALRTQSFAQDKGVALVLRLDLHTLGMPDGADVENDHARNTRPRLRVGTALHSTCDQRGWTRGVGADTEFRYLGLYVSGGYLWLRSSTEDDRFGYGDCGAIGTTFGQVHGGSHVQVQYVLPEVLFPVREQFLELGARLEWINPQAPYDSSRPARGGGDELPGYQPPTTSDRATRYGLTVGVSWHYSDLVRVQLNYRHEFENEPIVWPGTGLTHDKVQNDVLILQIQGRL